jgi:hypothetical protein
VASIVSAVNEVITISSSLFIPDTGDQNVKTYSNIASSSAGPALGGYWQTVFDSSPTSVQSTALFDVTFGFSTSSAYYAAAGLNATGSANEKVKIYQEMASLLLGNNGSTFSIAGSGSNECFFILVKRGIMKDELKKGVISLILSGNYNGYVTGTDTGAASSYKQTVGGDYAPIFSGTSTSQGAELGQVWYNAGVVVVPAKNANLPWINVTATSGAWSGSNPAGSSLTGAIVDSTIDSLVNGIRQRVDRINFQNQTNLYSTIYFCRATNTEFNYSSNPTYVDASQRIRVTSGSNVLQSRTYMTKVGLYDANDNLLAVGSVNKPIMKSPDTESIFRIRLDY